MPSTLFRYTHLNPEFEESIKRIFEKNEIYCPLVSQLNDPSDCIPKLDLSRISDNEIIEGLAKNYKKKKFDEKEIEKQLKYVNYVGPKKFLMYRFYYHLIPTFKKSRILSLSETCTDFSMWVYYARFFEGFCIEINLGQEWSEWLFPVRYSKDLNLFKPQELFEAKLNTRLFVNHKTIHWQHEKEWRIYNHHSNRVDFIPLPENGIARILLGMNISLNDKSKIVEWKEKFNRNFIISEQFIDQLGKIDFRNL